MPFELSSAAYKLQGNKTVDASGPASLYPETNDVRINVAEIADALAIRLAAKWSESHPSPPPAASPGLPIKHSAAAIAAQHKAREKKARQTGPAIPERQT